ncbi:MAG: alpha/beta hydrolase [Snowella sp.]|nr:alpha/beta hydrolase [Snowella sp.]
MMKLFFRRDRWIRPLVLAIASAVVAAAPLKAADRIFFTYAPVHVSVRIASVEQFANKGIVDANLRFYFNLLGTTPEQQTELRRLLKERVEIDPVQLSRFLNTAVAEDLLERLGRLVTIQGGRNGKHAIRGALISAALDPKGLTALNVLAKLPTDIQVQGEPLVEQGRITRFVVDATQEAIVQMAALSAKEAKAEPIVDFSQLTDPRQPGPYGFQPKVRWQLDDRSRNRRFYADVYQPKRWRNGQTPVVVVSHGLASRPEDFGSIGEHLASYGYLVVLPQHPGSDFQQAQNLLTGLSREVFYISEFLDRPKDISYLLDELERRNQTEFAGRLNLSSVGAIGHSFGGYGVLALAGAEIDWKRLKSECTSPNNYPNPSLLLQCRALDLPQESYDFRDQRITTVFAINPVNSALFGPEGFAKVKIPVVLLSGSFDPATPAVLEQIRTFPWVASEDKYLILSDGQAHVDFAQLDAGISDLIGSMGDFTLPDPDLLNTYRDALLVPFLEYYQSQNQTYKPFIESFSAYSQYLSQGQEFKIYLISRDSSQFLTSIIQQFRANRR